MLAACSQRWRKELKEKTEEAKYEEESDKLTPGGTIVSAYNTAKRIRKEFQDQRKQVLMEAREARTSQRKSPDAWKYDWRPIPAARDIIPGGIPKSELLPA